MKTKRVFAPEKVAYYEKAGWEAYYDRQWGRVFRLMVELNREEFGMPFLTALAAALDIVRASLAFKPVDNDIPKATEFLRRYYEKARRTTPIHSDAATLARLEMDYWIVHRQLALARMEHPESGAPDTLDDISPMVEALTHLHAALFNAPPAAVRRSAEMRALAAKTVDRITGKYSTNVKADWQQTERYLQQAYQALNPPFKSRLEDSEKKE